MKYIKEYNSDSYNNRIHEREYIEDLFLEYADNWGISEVDDVQEYEEEIINDELVTSICDTTIHTSGNGIYSYEINIAFKKGFLKKTKNYLLEELPDDFESDMLSFRNRLQKLGYFTEKQWGGSAQLYRITIVGNSISLKEHNNLRWDWNDESKHDNERNYISDLFLEYADIWGIKEVQTIMDQQTWGEIVDGVLPQTVFSVTVVSTLAPSYRLSIAFEKGLGKFKYSDKRWQEEEPLSSDFKSDIHQFRKKLQSCGYITKCAWRRSLNMYQIDIIGSASITPIVSEF